MLKKLVGLVNVFKKKEPDMSRKKEPVRWLITDGTRPNRVGPGRVFNLRSPTPLSVPPKATVTLKLGVECNYPLHVFQSRGCLQRGLHLSDGIWAAQDSDQELSLTIENRSGDTQLVERGDVLARAFIMDNSAFPDEE